MSKSFPRGTYRKNWDMPHQEKTKKGPKYKEKYMDEVEEDDDKDFFNWPEKKDEEEDGKREERQALSV